jgi:hypothetical protein
MRRIEISKAIRHHMCAINQGIHRHAVYYPELFEVFEYVAVEDGQVLAETDVSKEMAGLLVPDALYIPYKPLPCLIAVIDFAEYSSERDRVSVQELAPGLYDISCLLVDEPGPSQLLCDLGTISPKEHPRPCHILHCFRAHRAPGHGREDAKHELAEDLLFRTCLPHLLKLIQPAADLRPLVLVGVLDFLNNAILFDCKTAHRSYVIILTLWKQRLLGYKQR